MGRYEVAQVAAAAVVCGLAALLFHPIGLWFIPLAIGLGWATGSVMDRVKDRINRMDS